MILKLILSALLILAVVLVLATHQHAQMVRTPTKQEQKAMAGFQHDWNADNRGRSR